MRPCKCNHKFLKKNFGFNHWWRYTKIRYWLRYGLTRLWFTKLKTPNGEPYWVERTPYGPQFYVNFPGPSMSASDFRHWFSKMEKKKIEKEKSHLTLVK